jgi:hypothetical protein
VQGLLLLLGNRPWDIGDMIRFADPSSKFHDEGAPSGGWIVENVDPFATTMRSSNTREWRAFPNGSLATCSIINLNRSRLANVAFYLKFPIDSDRQQLRQFRQRIIGWIHDRPCEWIKMNAFRCVRVDSALQVSSENKQSLSITSLLHFLPHRTHTTEQYIEHILILQHMESWQKLGIIQESKSDALLFILDLQKELNLIYNTPQTPFRHRDDSTSKRDSPA